MLKAVWIILVADITMSLDNILAVAGASGGNLFLLLFGLGLSIPLVVSASALISKLMEKFAIVMWIGAAILGKVGGEMMATDPVVAARVLLPLGLCETVTQGIAHPRRYVVWIAEIVCTAGVLGVALWMRRPTAKQSTRAG